VQSSATCTKQNSDPAEKSRHDNSTPLATIELEIRKGCPHMGQPFRLMSHNLLIQKILLTKYLNSIIYKKAPHEINSLQEKG
jgi:hypothetical protein